MRIRAATILGALFIIAGVAALVHPRLSYPIERHSAMVAGSKVLFETRRVFHFPLWFSIPIMTIGVVLVIVGFQKD